MNALNNKTLSEIDQSPGLMQIIITIVATLIVITWLFFQADSFSEQEHARYSSLLHGLLKAESSVNGEVLANRVNLARNYDALVANINRLQNISEQITHIPGFLSADDQLELIDKAHQVQVTVKAKAYLIEQFKRNNAVLHNSLNYFHEYSDDVLDSGSYPYIRSFMANYVRHLMFFVQSPEPGRIDDLKRVTTELKSLSLGRKQQQIVNNLLQHGNIIKDYQLKLVFQLRELLSQPSAVYEEQLIQIYSQGHSNALRMAEQYRILLYAVALLLTSYLAFTFFDLERTRRSLVRAHKEVSARYQAQKKAESLLKLHDTAFNSAHEGITLTDEKGNIITVNPAFTRITGFEAEEVIGRNTRVLKSDRHDDAFYKAMWQSITDTGNWRGEIWNKNKFGEVHPELLSITTVYDSDDKVSNYVAVFSDIRVIKEQEILLKKMAYSDALTKLPNRTSLRDRMNLAIEQTSRAKNMMAICYLDLDGFKQINDTYGHDAGDTLLIEMSDRLKACLRGGDTVARLGGDEFVILLLGLDDMEYEQAMQRLMKTITRGIHVSGNLINLTASIGVTLYPRDDSDPDSLLRHADQAMYQAKQEGKNCYHLFDPGKDTLVRSQYERISRIDEALKANEFILYYQPKVDLRKGEITGMEALIRWQHPERGLVMPLEFLSIIEEHELIVKIGNWVIDTALQQMAEWQSIGLDLQVSVNIASLQLQQPDFVENLKNALSRYAGVEAVKLELEVLETAALEDIVNVSRVIEECRELGVSFALDDFGTGYSSLTYLKRLPASTLKIDRSFVRDMLHDPGNLAIVHSILGLATAFQRQAVAEGAETHEHCRLLQHLGCQYVQGYAIARPMPAAEVDDWVAKWRPDPSFVAYRNLHWNDEDYPIFTAEVEHQSWINLLMHAVNEGLPVSHKSVGDDHVCNLGKWYYGVGQRRYKHLASFIQIEEPHQQVHQLAEEIENHCHNGDFEQARELLPELLQQRDDIISLLQQLSLDVAIRLD